MADLYLEKAPCDQGFPFHTDFDSNCFMERPEQMISVWFPLTPVNSDRGGQLSVVVDDGAVRLSLIRVANQLHSLLRVVDKSVPPHRPFDLSPPEVAYLERTRHTPSLDPGDALVFCNAFFHKSEPVLKDPDATTDEHAEIQSISFNLDSSCESGRLRPRDCS